MRELIYADAIWICWSLFDKGGCCHTDCRELPILQLFLLCVNTCYMTEYQALAHCVHSYRYTDLDLYGGSDILSSEYIESTNLVTLKEPVSFRTVSKQLFNSSRKKHPSPLSSSVVTAEVLAFCKSFWCKFTLTQKCGCCSKVCTHCFVLYLHLGSV